jgi:putative flippase GtrA
VNTRSQLLSFAGIGVIGFAVDALTLTLLKGLLGLYGARVVSFLCAVLATWWLNRSITFGQGASGLSAGREFGGYLMLMLVGGAVNGLLYAWLVSTHTVVRAHPVLGVAAGSLAGMAINFLTSKGLLNRAGSRPSSVLNRGQDQATPRP